jgi:hypothetical protein
MAKGDRVRIDATTGIFSENGGQELVYVYEPRIDPNTGKPLMNPSDGTCLIECKGGITKGSFGFIEGETLKISKMSLKDYNGVPGIHGTDTTILIPVFLERYQRRGWFPADNVRIVAGGLA